MNEIDKKLFKDIEKKIEEESGKTLCGRSHPVNVILNLQDDIIEGYQLIQKLKQDRRKAEETIKRVNLTLGDKC